MGSNSLNLSITSRKNNNNNKKQILTKVQKNQTILKPWHQSANNGHKAEATIANLDTSIVRTNFRCQSETAS